MTDPHRPATSAIERQRRRSVAILIGLGAFLLISFLVAFAYIQGWFPAGSSGGEQVAAPPRPTTSSCAPAAPPPAPSSISVNVYNSTQRAGLAATTGAALSDQGFKVLAKSNDPLGTTVDAVAEIRFGTAAQAKADVLAQRFPGAVKVPDETRTDDIVDVAIGERFTALAPPPTAAPTPVC